MRRGLVLLTLIGLVPAAARAQTVTLSVSSLGSAMQNPTLANYDAGFVTDATPASYTVTLTNASAKNNCTYATAVQVRASSATIGNAKAISTVSWSTGGAYTALTQSWATIATHNLVKATGQSTVNTATGSLTFRVALAWSEPSASFAGTALEFQASVSPTGTGC